MTTPIKIGRMLRAGTTGFIVGCRVDQLDVPRFGGLVRAPVADSYQIYGLIYDIHIDDDGLVRQLATAQNVDANTIADNRVHRNVPVEISALSVGYEQNGELKHLLPPRPPLSLDVIYKCSPSELCAFTTAGRLGYFRHVLRSADLPVGELLAAHIEQAHAAHLSAGDPLWSKGAVNELITLLRDDYAALMAVLGALSDALGEGWKLGDAS
ncbi:MAG: hypothetical protein DRI56_13475 [Chloroflexota bacterium]|nr:MAG: hypothetical protein DRI56_13475 [Chloroflexota bacterium]